MLRKYKQFSTNPGLISSSHPPRNPTEGETCGKQRRDRARDFSYKVKNKIREQKELAGYPIINVHIRHNQICMH